LSQKIAQNVESGGSYRLLRIHQVNQEPRALFRMLGEGGVNYHDLHLIVDAHGHVRIVDVDVYITGEALSQTMRRSLVPVLGLRNQTFAAKALGIQDEYSKHLPQVVKVTAAARKGEHAEALALYRELPPALQKHQGLMMIAINASQQVDEEAYLKLLQAYCKEFPQSSGDLILLDVLHAKRKFDELLQAVDRLDRKLGGDAYLHTFRGAAHMEKKDFPAARRAFEACIRGEPKLADAYWGYITLELQQKNFTKVTELLTAVQTKAGVELEDLTKAEEYADFVKSPEGKAWLKKQAR